jgi:hypothetical protein
MPSMAASISFWSSTSVTYWRSTVSSTSPNSSSIL